MAAARDAGFSALGMSATSEKIAATRRVGQRDRLAALPPDPGYPITSALASLNKLTALTDALKTYLNKRCKHDHGRGLMIDMQFLDGVLIALAVLVGAAIALSVAILAVASVTKRGQAPYGGTRRDLPPHGGTRRDLPPLPQPDTDDARELVLR